MNNADKPQTKRVSVVICTYNRSTHIGAALQSLVEQDVSPDQFEVIIVDNNSNDGTAGICQAFISGPGEGHDIKYVLEPRRGLSFARNRGIAEAVTDIVCYIDDDAIAVPGYVKAVIDFFEKNDGVVGAGGRVLPKYEGGEPAWMSKYLNGFIGKVDFGESEKKFKGRMKFPAGCNMIYRKPIMEEVGGFNNELTFRSDDKYIFYQVTRKYPAVYYLPTAMVYHHIDKKRVEFGYFRTLFLKTGNEEKVRVRSESGFLGGIAKGVEYLLKTAVSMALYLVFLTKHQELKGRYIFLSQWFTLKGFCKKAVFVR